MIQLNAISALDTHAAEYDNWFGRHQDIFERELAALRKLIPATGKGIEIGAGTGRFTAALNIATGVEPSPIMAQLALARGIEIIHASAEELPVADASFDFALMVTTVCFLDDIPKAFSEVNRILKPGGSFIIGLIDKESELGKSYAAQKTKNRWYLDAHFHTVPEIAGLLQDAGFGQFDYWQTLFNTMDTNTAPEPGYGKGSFVVIGSQKI
jgi:SAM-dependent methyltransferase